ncbi:Syntaxin-binding protein 5-like [Cricetulus griseus]|uniref:Syntaxin-binding protein 5-like n=1 Tax=Cricetulus griseus TaxID=10029 RepID=G3HAI7_CRIGR|nr:Syntaxin-binding protein 5-like [Cricetulus griseus]
MEYSTTSNVCTVLLALVSLSGSTNTVSSEGVTKDSIPCLSVKTRPVRMPPGYQADLVIQLVWVDGEPPQQITSLAISSAYGIVAFGNCTGLVVVDFIQKTVLLSMGTIDLYRSSDLYQRQPRSPRKNKQFIAGLTELNDSPVPLELERCKSPTSDHVNGHCTSPTSQSCSSGKRLSSADVSKVNRWGPGRPPFRKAQSAACMEISLPVTTEEARENSYNRSRSSSISSIDKDSKEAVTALYFMESFARKNDSTVSPCLFVGTSLGMVLLISLNLPSSDEQRFTEPVMVLPSVGEATAGKASRSLAQHIPGPGSIEGMKGAAGGVMGELTRARIALDERGQRLGELEEKTAGMMTSAEAFSKHAHEVWQFSSLFSKIKSWEFNEVTSMSEHLKTCPFNIVEHKTDPIRLTSMCQPQEQARESLVSTFRARPRGRHT